MYNCQGLSVRQIWKCSKDYDMWPLYALGLLFGIPKYPVTQYLTLSFRDFGFNVIQSNLLSIPYIVGSSITMLLITAFSELVNNRSFVAMAEDAWLLPCFVALIALPDPISGWAYFAIATVLLSFPYTHPIQVAWTSRNAGSVQNRTVSASLYNMFVQVSGMIGANIPANRRSSLLQSQQRPPGYLCMDVSYPVPRNVLLLSMEEQPQSEGLGYIHRGRERQLQDNNNG